MLAPYGCAYVIACVNLCGLSPNDESAKTAAGRECRRPLRLLASIVLWQPGGSSRGKIAVVAVVPVVRCDAERCGDGCGSAFLVFVVLFVLLVIGS